MFGEFLFDPTQTILGRAAPNQTFDETFCAEVPAQFQRVEQIGHFLRVFCVRGQLASQLRAALLTAGQVRQGAAPQGECLAADQAASSELAVPRWFTP